MRQKITVRPLLLLLLLAGLCSCDARTLEIGENWLEKHTRVVIIDTCTVELSTVLLDSIPTSGADRIMTGIYRSGIFGETTLIPYLTFNRTTDFSVNEGERLRFHFDSLTLVLPYSNMYCGDTTRQMTLALHRLNERVELNDKGALYGHSRFSYDSQPLLTQSFYPKPASGRNLEIRLPDELGAEFLAKLINSDKEMESNEDFQKYFNGLVLVPDPSCEAQVSFMGRLDSLGWMRLHYHTLSHERVDKEIDFLLSKNIFFHQIDIDRTETAFDGLSWKNNDISSRRTDNTAMIHGLAGTYTKIEFPHLNEILKLGDHGHVVSANLTIHPLKGSYGKHNHSPLADTVEMYISNEVNITTGAITNQNQEIQSGSLSYSDHFQEETYYSYDVTEFISGQLGKSGVYKSSLQMIGAKYGYTLKNTAIGNQENGDYNVRLRIIYSIYNE